MRLAKGCHVIKSSLASDETLFMLRSCGIRYSLLGLYDSIHVKLGLYDHRRVGTKTTKL